MIWSRHIEWAVNIWEKWKNKSSWYTSTMAITFMLIIRNNLINCIENGHSDMLSFRCVFFLSAHLLHKMNSIYTEINPIGLEWFHSTIQLGACVQLFISWRRYWIIFSLKISNTRFFVLSTTTDLTFPVLHL